MAIKAGQRTVLAEFNAGSVPTARDVAQAAHDGDQLSQQLLADAGRHIGSALASLINLLNPGMVIIGGGVSGAGAYLLDSLHQASAERTMPPSLQGTQVVLTMLGRRAVALSAAALALARTCDSYA